MPLAPTTPLTASEFLPALLDLSLSGIVCYAPLLDEAGQLRDFAFTYVNPAAQRLLGVPAQPTATYCEQFPEVYPTGGFAFHGEAFAAGGAVRYTESNYQAGAYNHYFRLAARRVGEQLLVSFTTSSEQDRNPVEDALRRAQAREQAAHAEAEAQRLRLYDVLQHLPAQVATHQGPDHMVTFVNARFQAFAPSAPLLGRPVREAAAGVVEEAVFHVLDEVYRTGETRQLREVAVNLAAYQAAPVKPLFINASYHPLRDATGRVYGVLDFSYDVTEQVLARRQAKQLNLELESRVQQRTQQLEEQRGLLSRIMGQVPAVVAALSGPAHRFAFFNEAYQQVVAGRAVLGQPIAEALPEIVAQGFLSQLDQVYQTGELFRGVEVPAVLTQAAGPPRSQYFNFTYQPLLDGQRAVQGILVFAVDVTEQVLARVQAQTLQAAGLATAQRQVQQREELYRILEQALTAVVLLREPDHRIDYHNPAFAAIFPPDEAPGPLQGRTLGAAYPHLREAGLIALLDEVYRTGQPQLVVDFPLANLQPGSPRYVTFSYQAYYEQGRVAGVAAFVYDVTEQVLTRRRVLVLNEELRTSNEQLRRTNADLDTFVYTASHDLKAPITNLAGLLEALRDELPAAGPAELLVPRLLGMMDGAIARFQQTLGHLTDITRLDQATTQPAELLDLAPVVAGVCLDLAPLLESTYAQVQVELSACPQVHCAPKVLRSTLYNLLSNAVKYRAPDRPPVVQVRAYHLGEQAVVEVQDNGLGLSETQQRQLFGLFQRLHPHIEGSGVGLYMIKRLLLHAGGTITVASQLGVGSTFTVTFAA